MAIENPALTTQSFARGSAEASAAERQGMTAAGTFAKTVVLLVLLVAAAAFGWSQVEIVQAGNRAVAVTPWWTWLAFLLTFIFAFAGVFAYRAIPIIAPLYALSEGALLGIASRYYDAQSQGIVALAVLATLAIFIIMLILYGTGIIKVTPGFAMGVSIAIGGLLILYLNDLAAFALWREPFLSLRADAAGHSAQPGHRHSRNAYPADRLRVYPPGLGRRGSQVHGVVRGLWSHAFAHLDVRRNLAVASSLARGSGLSWSTTE